MKSFTNPRRIGGLCSGFLAVGAITLHPLLAFADCGEGCQNAYAIIHSPKLCIAYSEIQCRIFDEAFDPINTTKCVTNYGEDRRVYQVVDTKDCYAACSPHDSGYGRRPGTTPTRLWKRSTRRRS